MKLTLLLVILASGAASGAEPAPTSSPLPPSATPAPTSVTQAASTPGAGISIQPIEEAEHAVIVDGFMYMDFAWTQQDPGVYFVGRGSGFRMFNMRLEMQGRPTGRFGFDVSVDAAIDNPNATNSLLGNKIVQLKDGLVWFDILPQARLRLTAGQFIFPFGAEALLPDADLPFVRRSILSAGIQVPEGRPTLGLWLDRQLGLSVHYQMPRENPGLGVELVIGNGNGANQLLNDNSQFLLLARIEGWLGPRVTLGLNGYYNPRTLEDPALQGTFYDETDLGAGVDLTLHLGGLRVVAMALWKEIQFPTIAPAPTQHTYGAMGHALYTLPDALFGIQVGYRYTYYQPNNTVLASELQEHDFLVAYPFPGMPVRLIAQFSWRLENPAVQITNNGVDVMLQALF